MGCCSSSLTALFILQSLHVLKGQRVKFRIRAKYGTCRSNGSWLHLMSLHAVHMTRMYRSSVNGRVSETWFNPKHVTWLWFISQTKSLVCVCLCVCVRVWLIFSLQLSKFSSVVYLQTLSHPGAAETMTALKSSALLWVTAHRCCDQTADTPERPALHTDGEWVCVCVCERDVYKEHLDGGYECLLLLQHLAIDTCSMIQLLSNVCNTHAQMQPYNRLRSSSTTHVRRLLAATVGLQSKSNAKHVKK